MNLICHDLLFTEKLKNMIFKKFYIGVIARVLAIVICAYIFALTKVSEKYLHTIIVSILLIVGLTANLIWYVNKTNRLLSTFFSGLMESPDNLKLKYLNDSNTFGSLTRSIQGTWDLLKESRLEEEKERLFMKYIVGNIGNGILAYTFEGEILLANPALKELFGFSELHNTDQLKKLDKDLNSLLMNENANAKSYIKVVANDSVLELLVYISQFKLREQEVRLASFQNINEKLSQKEIDAWQSIIRVLSHEIMSSFSPITSLSDHLSIELDKGIDKETGVISDQDLTQDLIKGLKIIAGRSQGIMEFVKKYREISTPLKPQFKRTEINQMLLASIMLAKKEFKGLEISYKALDSISLMLDRGLIEQCILNLIRNAWQATEEKQNRKLIINVKNGISELLISFEDNGEGIDPEIIDNIFIPFFTTRKDGSGIGLSFTRKVLMQHGGNVSVNSFMGKGSTVRLHFPKISYKSG